MDNMRYNPREMNFASLGAFGLKTRALEDLVDANQEVLASGKAIQVPKKKSLKIVRTDVFLSVAPVGSQVVTTLDRLGVGYTVYY